ncbi:MAG: PAS domain S-box protein [Vicinamibacterales bacterium]
MSVDATAGIPSPEGARGADDPPLPWTSVAAQALDSLPSRIAVVDSSGTIVAVNRSWRTFAHLHGASDAEACEGRNIFDVCGATDDVDRDVSAHLVTALRQVLDGTLPLYEEDQVCHLPHAVLWTGVRISPLTLNGHVMAVVAYDDITPRKEMEIALRETQAALDRAQTMAAVGSWRADFRTQTFTPSTEGSRLLGWSPGSRPFSDLFALIHPDDRERQREAWMRALHERTTFDLEHRMLLRGEVRWVHARAEFVFGPDGRAVEAWGVTQDITERRRMSDAVTEERARLRSVLNTIPDLVFVKDTTGRWVACNPALERFLGKRETELLGRTDADLFPREDATQFQEDDAEVCRTGRTIRREEDVVSADGVLTSFETIKTPMYRDGELIGVLGIARDVTEQRRVTRALAESEQQKEFTLDAGQFGSWQRLPGSGTVVLDARAGALWDVDVDRIDVGDLVRSRVHEDDRQSILDVPRQAGRYAVEFRIRPRDGSERWVLAHVRVASAPDGQEPMSHGTVQDITERKRAEEMVARFVSASPVVIYALQVEQGGERPVRWFSGNLRAMTGWTGPEARTPRWWVENVHPDDRSALAAGDVATSGQEHRIREFRFRRADGRFVWIRDEQRLLRDRDGRPSEVVGSWSDITQRVELEDRLRQSQKLEAIGLLAGGIAHDFNNLLTVIGGNADLLRYHADTGEAGKLLAEIRATVDRATALTRGLLAFSRAQVMAPRTVAVNDVLRRMAGLLARLIGEDVRCEYDLAETAGFVRVDDGQFEQVMLNLAVNARDAMPAGGRLVVSTAREEIDGSHPDLQPGPHVRIAVTDTGVGMAPEVAARIFEPFFTTKGAGRGTGLGLSTAFGVVKQSGGHIEVQSEPGLGATFAIYLPQVSPPPVPSVEPTVEAVPRRGHETVLLVEDEDSVRKLARLALERNGYTVLAAGNAASALDVARTQRVDLLVTDVVMPGMRGPDLAQALRGIFPTLKVLFVSGYVQDAADRAGVSGSNFLMKPFTLKEFADKVRGILDGPV